MANNQLLASDNFASGSLAAGWSAQFGVSVCKVVGSGSSAVTEPNTTNVSAGQLWTGLMWPKDQVSEVTLAPGWVNASNVICQLNVRFSSVATSGYAVNLAPAGGATGTAVLYIQTAGVTTQLTMATGLTIAAGDVWSLQAYGPCLVLYQNYKVVLFWVDTTYTSGSPGFLLNATTITNAQISSWRGYNAVQQDGIWQKQGSANIPLVSTDINTGTSFVNSGIDSSTIILHEANAQILSGMVYKMWFGTASGIQYAESTDGINWSRFGSTVISGFSFPQVFKNGSTYYLYCQSNTVAAGTGNINLFTSTDGIHWTNISSTVLALGTAGAWDATAIYLFSPVYIDGGGIWHALYSGVNASNAFAMGVATSVDGITWTKYVSNPVAPSVWASVPYLINGKWWLWGEGVPPGQAVSTIDPTVGIRLNSVDLITWSTPIPSIQHSQLSEGVNSIFGFSYPNSLISVGSKTYMYFETGPANTASNTGSSWNLSLAIAPTSILGLILFPENASNQIATDFFTNAPPNLSSNWTLPTGGTALKIVVGPFVEPTTLSTLCQAVYTGTLFDVNQYSEVILQTLTGTLLQSFIQPTVRASVTALTAYEGLVGSPTNTTDAAAQIVKRVNGVGTQIGPTATVKPKVGDTWRLSVITGNDGFPVLSLYQNGFLILQVQDKSSTPITSGNPGIQAFSSVAIADAQISSWAGGNANVIPSYGGVAVGWSPVDSRTAIPGMGPAANTGIVDSQGNVIYSAQKPPFTGNSQVSDNTAIPLTDSRTQRAPVDSRANVPVNSRTAPPFKS